MKDQNPQQAAPGAALDSQPELITKQVFSHRMSWSVRKTDQLCHDRRIPFVKLGKMVRIPWPEARDHLLRNYQINAHGQ